ncbi:MAG TPA: four-helix bundle copper-binding protein, partial [Fibrobacteria bacterium]|nr:four-helix bundle copper-binding protein [Fibrobacteria bacterium]
CASACLADESVDSLRRCIRLDLDCSDACLQTARALLRGSEMSVYVCRLCAEICDRCAEECRNHAGMMEYCRVCAEACEAAAEACRMVAPSAAFA